MGFSTGIRWIAALPLLAAAFNPNEPPVVADSAAIRAVYEEPVPADYFRLWVARSKLSIAGDNKAAEALDRYFTGVAVGILTRNPVTPRGTLGDVISGAVKIDDVQAGVTRILSTTLKPEVVTALGPRKHVPEMLPTDFTQYREDAPGVWVSHHRDRPAVPDWVHLPVNIRNVSSLRVSQSDKRLVLALAGGGDIKFECKEPRFELTPIPPGEAVLHDCRSDVRHAPLPEVIAAVREPSRWSLDVSRITFEDPKFGLTRGHTAYGVDAQSPRSQAEAHRTAQSELRALNCFQRNACLEDFKRGPGPFIIALLVMVGIGAAVAAPLALWTRRRWMWGGISVVGYVVFSVALVAFFAMKGGDQVLIALLVAAAAAIGLGAFLVGLLATLAIVRRPPPQE
jgi:hypothetical protein